jgi:hypothetical protein
MNRTANTATNLLDPSDSPPVTIAPLPARDTLILSSTDTIAFGEAIRRPFAPNSAALKTLRAAAKVKRG